MALTKIPGFGIDTSTFALASANITGNLTSGNANLGNLAIANYFSGNGSLLTGINTSIIANGNSNVNIPTSNGNITISSAGVANIVIVTSTGVNVSGYLNTTGNINGGNINGGNLVSANYFVGNGSLLTSLTGANVTGNVPYASTANYANTANAVSGTNVSGQVSNSLIAGTVYTAAQPNITSVGTLTSLTVTGNTSTGNLTGANLVSANYVTGTLTTASQPNITSVGTLSSLTVTGNITGGNANLGNLVVANYFSGNGSLLTGVISSYTNTNVASYLPTYTGNLSGGNLSLTGNVTSVLNVTGNTNVGNLNTTGLVSAGNISANNLTLSGNLVVGGTTTYINSTVTDIDDPIIELGGGSNGALLTVGDGKDRGLLLHRYEGTAGAGGFKIDSFMGWSNTQYEYVFASNATVSSDVVTVNSYGNVHANYFKGDGSQLTGIAATTSISLINGNSNVVVQPSGNVGISVGGTSNVLNITSTSANLTGNANISGNITAGNSVSATYFVGSGQYLTGLGALTNGNSSISIVQNGPVIMSANGSYAILQVQTLGTNAAGYLTVTGALTAPNITTTTFANIGGNLTAGNASLGNTVTANYFTGTLTTASQPNITSIGTLGNLVVTSNITSGNANLGNLVKANYIQGDGYLISNIGSPNTVVFGTTNINILNTNGNVTFTVNANANVAVVTGTGVNIAGYLNVTGNTVSGNASLGNLATANYVSVSNNVTVTGNLTSGNASLGNLASANYFTGIYANGNSSINIPSINGNINLSAVGVANVLVVTGTGINVAGTTNITGNITGGNLITANYFTGTLTTSNQLNITSLGNLLNLTVTNNANIGGNVQIGNTNIVLANTGAIIASGTITGANANLGNTVTANYFTGILTTASQPNITSIGTLGNLVVTNNVSANVLTTSTGSNANLTINPDGTGQLIIDTSTPVIMSNTLTSNGNVLFSGANVTLGPAGNLHITGGTVNQYLKTDGAGNLSWGTPSGGGGGGTSLTYTAAATPPGSANIADQWYNTVSSTLYEYISDGTTNYWVDIQTPTVSSSSPAPLMIQNNGSNLTYASTLNFAGAGINATYTGNTVTATVVATETISPFLLMGA